MNIADAPDNLALQKKALVISKIYFQKNLESPAAQAYLASRGITVAACRRFEVGYAPDSWRGLVDHFSAHKVRLAAADAGLLKTINDSNRLIDHFRDRLIFPIHTHTGELVGYGGRILTPKEGAPKYINTPETALFNKSQVLYGLHQNGRRILNDKKVIISEGYVDVISLAVNGFDYAAAPMGTSLTAEQVTLLLKLGVHTIYIGLDGDKAGIQATERSLQVIMDQYHPALDIRILSFPDGHDPDSLIKERGADAFQAVLDTSTPLDQYIHSICTKGLPEKPCLEDKALYLLRMDDYLQKSAGLLQNRLLSLASSYSALPEHLISQGKLDRSRAAAASQWHDMVALSARWMMFASNSKAIAGRLETTRADSSGLADLRDLAKQVSKGETGQSLLGQFARAHGPLNEVELKHLQENWTAWYKNTNLESQITRLREVPFDMQARASIRSLLSPGQ